MAASQLHWKYRYHLASSAVTVCSLQVFTLNNCQNIKNWLFLSILLLILFFDYHYKLNFKSQCETEFKLNDNRKIIAKLIRIVFVLQTLNSFVTCPCNFGSVSHISKSDQSTRRVVGQLLNELESLTFRLHLSS